MTTVALTLEIDEPEVRRAYDEYVADYQWYVDNEPDTLDHPAGTEYAAGGPLSWERYLERWTESVLEDVLGGGFTYTIKRAAA